MAVRARGAVGKGGAFLVFFWSDLMWNAWISQENKSFATRAGDHVELFKKIGFGDFQRASSTSSWENLNLYKVRFFEK